MRINGRHYEVDWGHLVFVGLIATATIWYLLDARSVSLSANNLLLVQPVAIFAIVTVLFILPQCLRKPEGVAGGVDEKPAEAEAIDDPLAPKLPTGRSEVARMSALGIALGAFVLSIRFIGFDTAIFLFVLAAMAICGERRPHYLLLFAGVVMCVAVYGFRALMPYPMPTLFL